MATINLKIKELKNISSEIENQDKTLLSTNIPEVISILNQIKQNVQQTYNIDASIARIIENIDTISSELRFELSKLERFIKFQIETYEYTEAEIEAELNEIIQRLTTFVLASGHSIPGVKTPTDLGEGAVMTDEDWKISTHASKEDFRCNCGGKYCNGYPVGVDKRLIEGINKVGEHFGATVTITSGLRCNGHNSRTPGSASNSRHTRGKAVDFRVDGVSSRELMNYVKTLEGYNYTYTNNSNMSGVVHFDVS